MTQQHGDAHAHAMLSEKETTYMQVQLMYMVGIAMTFFLLFSWLIIFLGFSFQMYLHQFVEFILTISSCLDVGLSLAP